MRRVHSLDTAVLALILASGLVIHSGCGGSSANPTGPSTVVPTPTAAPTAPPATPPPTSALSACSRLERVVEKSACNVTSGSLTNEVSDAIDRVIGNRPDLFELGATNTSGDPHIKDQEGYYQAVIAELDKAGICAARVGSTELDIHVTNSYNFSDRFQIMTGYAYPWRGKKSYVESCTPAALPKAEINSVDWIFVTAYGTLNCNPNEKITNPFVSGNKAEIPIQCEASVTATPKTWGGLDVPEDISGTEVEWVLVEGDFVFWEWETKQFNVTLSPRYPGPAKLCATIKGVTGCLNGVINP